MQQTSYTINKGNVNTGGKILKIVHVGNSGSNYVTAFQGYNAYPIRSVQSSNSNNISTDVLGSLLAQNQINFSSTQVSSSGLLQSENMNLNQPMNSSLNVQNQLNNSSQHNSRKPCNCTKSHCLKLYCECFANGQLCDMCNCTNCMNNLNYEEERARAIKMTLDRNPTAFHPKIGRGEGERKHTKGCNCKRSGCLKNYCECYEAKISCTDSCRCQGCKNTEDSIERRSLKRLTALSSLKSSQPDAITRNLIKPSMERLPHSFLTWDVIEGITNCLLAKAEELESTDITNEQQERKLIDIYGFCLNKVIETSRSASFHAANQYSLMDMNSNVQDVMKSFNNDSARRDILIHRSDMDDDEDLDVDLEDTIVMNEEDEDSEVIYNRRDINTQENLTPRMSKRRGRSSDNFDPVWKPNRPKNNRHSQFTISPNRNRNRKNFDVHDEMLNA